MEHSEGRTEDSGWRQVLTWAVVDSSGLVPGLALASFGRNDIGGATLGWQQLASVGAVAATVVFLCAARRLRAGTGRQGLTRLPIGAWLLAATATFVVNLTLVTPRIPLLVLSAALGAAILWSVIARVIVFRETMFRDRQRGFDIVVLGLVGVPATLVGIVAAVLVGLTSRGPVFFVQDRVGRDGEFFPCLKFRTMFTGNNPLIPDASRITGIGRWLRRFSLDELPQLINVARGEMSIVGPRPMQPFQAERCSPRQAERHLVRPGLTGLAQVSGRNELLWESRIELDLQYVEQRSLSLDLDILSRTAQTILSGHGVDGHDSADPFVIDADDEITIDLREPAVLDPRTEPSHSHA